MGNRRRGVGVLFAVTAFLASLAGAVSPASAADTLATSEVSESKWQQVWAEVGHPGTADRWQCYGRPRQFDRDPTWVILWYAPRADAECAGLPGDPYPWLVHKSAGSWGDVAMLGPVECGMVAPAVLASGGRWVVVKDLMKDQWCETSTMWRAYMDRFLDTRKCDEALTPRPHKSVVGYIGRIEQSVKVTDGAVAWTCARGTDGVQEQFLSVFLAGPVPDQLITALDMDQFESLKIRGSRIHVTGGAFSGNGPQCCPDLRVTVQYKVRDGQLVELDKSVTPIE